MGPIRTIEELIDLLKRRWLLIVAVTVLGTLAALIYAVSKQHLYHSSEVIQVQTPMVSESIAPTIDAGSSARRLQLIEQQIMSRTSLSGTSLRNSPASMPERMISSVWRVYSRLSWKTAVWL